MINARWCMDEKVQLLEIIARKLHLELWHSMNWLTNVDIRVWSTYSIHLYQLNENNLKSNWRHVEWLWIEVKSHFSSWIKCRWLLPACRSIKYWIPRVHKSRVNWSGAIKWTSLRWLLYMIVKARSSYGSVGDDWVWFDFSVDLHLLTKWILDEGDVQKCGHGIQCGLHSDLWSDLQRWRRRKDEIDRSTESVTYKCETDPKSFENHRRRWIVHVHREKIVEKTSSRSLCVSPERNQLSSAVKFLSYRFRLPLLICPLESNERKKKHTKFLGFPLWHTLPLVRKKVVITLLRREEINNSRRSRQTRRTWICSSRNRLRQTRKKRTINRSKQVNHFYARLDLSFLETHGVTIFDQSVLRQRFEHYLLLWRKKPRQCHSTLTRKKEVINKGNACWFERHFDFLNRTNQGIKIRLSEKDVNGLISASP